MRTASLAALITLSAAAFTHSPASPGQQPRGDARESNKVVYEAKGYLVPVSQVSVSPGVGGQIIELTIEEGKVVQKGDVLARLENAEYKAELDAAMAKVELARVRLEHGKDGKAVALAKAEVSLAKAEAEKARWRFDATIIRAPITGTILTKKAEVGNVVNPRAFNLSASICEMADLRQLEVDVAIPEQDLAKVAKGQPCVIRLAAFPTTTYKGRVSRLMPVGDRARGALPVRVRIDVPPGDTQLRPEMSAIVAFLDAK